MPAIASAADLPPVRELQGVDRATFEREIVPAAEPVLMRGLVADWPLVRARPDAPSLAAALAELDSGRPIETFVGGPDQGGRFFYREGLESFNFARHRVPLSATLAKLVEQVGDPHPHAVYAGAAATAQHMPRFTASHPMPLLDDQMLARIWIGNAVIVPTHFDESRNIACVLAGRRRFTLFPPDQVANLYVGPLDNTMAGQPSSMVDLNAPDFARFPRFRAALDHARVADLAPGDALYVPALWWHQVQSFDALNVLVNYWWSASAEGSAFVAMVHALLAVRALAPAERAAWHAFFDHFVFDPPADGLAHLPARALGILGPTSAERTQRIKRYLLNALAR